MSKKFIKNIILTLLYVTMLIALCYLVTRAILFYQARIAWYETVIGLLLIFAETFIILHGIGYLSEIVSYVIYHETLEEKRPEITRLAEEPLIAIVIPAYHEPLKILDETLSCCYNLSYKNKMIILLDDTKYDQIPDAENYKKELEETCQKLSINLFRHSWRGAKAGIINDYIRFGEGKKAPGLEYIENDQEHKGQKSAFIAVFDADQSLFIDFLEPLASLMEQNPKLAFVQTPQYYTNFEENKVAKAAGLQQIIFYEYICVGKSNKNAMFCCGTNVLFRRQALVDVGGFDETSVTEDFATSLLFHLKGYQTYYYSKVGAFGLGPEDLGEYFKQQFRWALGTIGLLKRVFIEFIKHPTKMSLFSWVEYLLSSTHYFVGAVFVILLICPIIYILFEVPSYFASPLIYASVYVPYILITLFSFFWTLRKRHYSIRELILGQFLMIVSFPVYIKAAFYAIIGKKEKFQVTQKGESKSLPLHLFWPQIAMALLCYIAIVWGINKIYYEREYVVAICINIFWCLYNFFIMLSIFYFNKPLIIENSEASFPQKEKQDKKDENV